MGNRAVITHDRDLKGVGIYLHWNGGRDSVEAFLKYCSLKGYRGWGEDTSYAVARMTNVIANFFGGSLSIGVDVCSRLDCDNWDNGVYFVDGWEIAGRKFYDGPEQNGYDLNEMLVAIDECQPEKERFGKGFLMAEEIPVSQLKVGDVIYYQDWNWCGEVSEQEVFGIGEDRVVNGTNVKGIPYIALYNSEFPDTNINNYLRSDTVKIKK